MFKVSLRSVGAFAIFSNLVSREWLAVEQNAWNLGHEDNSNTHMGTFDPVVFKVILDHSVKGRNRGNYSDTSYNGYKNFWPVSSPKRVL